MIKSNKLPFHDRNTDTFGLSLIYILIIVALIVILAIWAGQAHAEKYPEKQVIMNISKGDLVYCHYGNPKTPTVVCDSIELKDSFTMVDRFMQMLEFGK